MMVAIPPGISSWDRTNALMRAAQALADRATVYIEHAKKGDWQYWASRSIRAQRASLRLMRYAEKYVPRQARRFPC